MSAIFKVWHRINNMTRSIDASLLKEQPNPYETIEPYAVLKSITPTGTNTRTGQFLILKDKSSFCKILLETQQTSDQQHRRPDDCEGTSSLGNETSVYTCNVYIYLYNAIWKCLLLMSAEGHCAAACPGSYDHSCREAQSPADTDGRSQRAMTDRGLTLETINLLPMTLGLCTFPVTAIALTTTATIIKVTIYTVSQKKRARIIMPHNSRKCRLMLIILSLSHSQTKCR